MNLRESFNDAFPRRVWLFSLVIYICIATPILYLSGYTSEAIGRNSFYYILSAQAQTLGTILALVATFTLVAAQLVTRYGHLLLQRVLAPWVFWYVVPFMIGIVAPLFILNGSFALWVARLTLLLGGLCIILLVPFFIAVRRQLSMASVIDDLRDTICDSSSDDNAYGALKSLSAILVGAMNLRDYETFQLGIECINNSCRVELSGERIILIAGELRLLVSRSVDDRIAMEALLSKLNEVSLHVYTGADIDVKKKLIGNLADTYKNLPSTFARDFVDEVRIIKELGVQETVHTENEITRECQRLLHNVGRVIIIESIIDDELPILVISAIEEIAQSCISQPVSEGRKAIVASSITRIEDFGILANSKNLKGITESILDKLKSLEEQLERYHEDLFRAAKAARESVQSHIGTTKG